MCEKYSANEEHKLLILYVEYANRARHQDNIRIAIFAFYGVLFAAASVKIPEIKAPLLQIFLSFLLLVSGIFAYSSVEYYRNSLYNFTIFADEIGKVLFDKSPSLTAFDNKHQYITDLQKKRKDKSLTNWNNLVALLGIFLPTCLLIYSSMRYFELVGDWFAA